MSTFLLVLAIWICLLILGSLYRISAGPTVFDRAIGTGLIGTLVTSLLLLVGGWFERIDMFVDLALAYAMLNFIGVVALARYLEGKTEKGELE